MHVTQVGVISDMNHTAFVTHSLTHSQNHITALQVHDTACQSSTPTIDTRQQNSSMHFLVTGHPSITTLHSSMNSTEPLCLLECVVSKMAKGFEGFPRNICIPFSTNSLCHKLPPVSHKIVASSPAQLMVLTECYITITKST